MLDSPSSNCNRQATASCKYRCVSCPDVPGTWSIIHDMLPYYSLSLFNLQNDNDNYGAITWFSFVTSRGNIWCIYLIRLKFNLSSQINWKYSGTRTIQRTHYSYADVQKKLSMARKNWFNTFIIWWREIKSALKMSSKYNQMYPMTLNR